VLIANRGLAQAIEGGMAGLDNDLAELQIGRESLIARGCWQRSTNGYRHQILFKPQLCLSIITDHVKSHYELDPAIAIAIAYLYFDFNDRGEQLHEKLFIG
jgi:hypothetical protein